MDIQGALPVDVTCGCVTAKSRALRSLSRRGGRAHTHSPGVYLVGLIDVLQEWNWTKWTELRLKQLRCHCLDWWASVCAGLPPRRPGLC